MNRREELLKCFDSVNDKKTVIINLIDEAVFLESKLIELKKLPFLIHHPRKPEIVKPSPVAKMYKDYLQQYNHTIKNLCSFLRKDESKEESPLRLYLKELNK